MNACYCFIEDSQPTHVFWSASMLENSVLCPEDILPEILINQYIFKEGLWIDLGLSPGAFYKKNIILEKWLPDLDAARASKFQQVSTELNTRLYLPCNGFDADKVSRDRISGTIARLQRGDGLPAGWMGWRDAENNMHWEDASPETVLTNLQSLARAIEDREQSLLISAWTHKANLQSIVEAIEQDADNFESLLNYDTFAGWP